MSLITCQSKNQVAVSSKPRKILLYNNAFILTKWKVFKIGLYNTGTFSEFSSLGYAVDVEKGDV